ncbi:putative rNA polymerase sigma factor [Mycobacterium kansasii 662]|uniref:Putative rNA polymerase sigma factor n=1 Tax=Mycobacterium kansasii 662 TaxID=1299326 RepID=X7XNV4_MYCKA|nr:putative rNA polymerase sigma factor [Mycobacterium kansasii 662]
MATITALPRYRDRGRPFLAFLYGIAGAQGRGRSSRGRP